jgi:hypothetical protein
VAQFRHGRGFNQKPIQLTKQNSRLAKRRGCCITAAFFDLGFCLKTIMTPEGTP